MNPLIHNGYYITSALTLKDCILPTQCIYVCHIIHAINKIFFTYTALIGLCRGKEIVFFDVEIEVLNTI